MLTFLSACHTDSAWRGGIDTVLDATLFPARYCMPCGRPHPVRRLSAPLQAARRPARAVLRPRPEGDEMVLTTYGRSSGFCIDPIEKKPLNHFLPGTPVFSFGTAGCNLTCKFCQNWDISQGARNR